MRLKSACTGPGTCAKVSREVRKGGWTDGRVGPDAPGLCFGLVEILLVDLLAHGGDLLHEGAPLGQRSGEGAGVLRACEWDGCRKTGKLTAAFHCSTALTRMITKGMWPCSVGSRESRSRSLAHCVRAGKGRMMRRDGAVSSVCGWATGEVDQPAGRGGFVTEGDVGL